MKRQWLNFLVNPFEWIAGGQALGWGLLGMVVSTVICYLSGWHYHGLLHFGPAPNPAWWCYAVEHLVVWIVPAVLFYLGGLILSRSRIRVIDVLGTVAFAQLSFYLYEFIQYAASDAKPGEDRYECAADGTNGSTRFPGRDMAVVDRYDIFGVGIGLDVQGFESVL